MEQLIELSPKFLGQNLLTHLHSELVKKVEGTCAGSLGYIVCVIDIKERDEVWIDCAHTNSLRSCMHYDWRRAAAAERRRETMEHGGTHATECVRKGRVERRLLTLEYIHSLNTMCRSSTSSLSLLRPRKCMCMYARAYAGRDQCRDCLCLLQRQIRGTHLQTFRRRSPRCGGYHRQQNGRLL